MSEHYHERKSKMPYIRKNWLTINDATEVYEIVREDGAVSWFGNEDQLSELLGTDEWAPGDEVAFTTCYRVELVK